MVRFRPPRRRVVRSRCGMPPLHGRCGIACMGSLIPSRSPCPSGRRREDLRGGLVEPNLQRLRLLVGEPVEQVLVDREPGLPGPGGNQARGVEARPLRLPQVSLDRGDLGRLWPVSRRLDRRSPPWAPSPVFRSPAPCCAALPAPWAPSVSFSVGSPAPRLVSSSGDHPEDRRDPVAAGRRSGRCRIAGNRPSTRPGCSRRSLRRAPPGVGGWSAVAIARRRTRPLGSRRSCARRSGAGASP